MADLMDYGRYTPHNVTGGGLGGASENPVSGFMQGYSFVRNQQRQDAADAQEQKRSALQDQLLQSKVDEVQNQRQINLNAALANDMRQNPTGWWKNYDDDTLNQVFSGLKSNPDLAYLTTPEGRNAFKLGATKIMSGMPSDQNGGNFDLKSIKDGVNLGLKPQLMKGTDANGRTDFLDKSIAGFVPAPSRDNFYMTVQTTDNQGNVDVAPVTERRSADPNDPVKAFTIPGVMDALRHNAAIVNWLDSQNARLGDQEALKRISAQSRNHELLNQIDQIDPNLSPEDRRTAITRAVLAGGGGVNEATTLGANMGASPKDRTLDDANKAAAVFNHNVGYLYDNPGTAAALAEQIKDASPVLAGQLRNLSQIKDKDQYNAAVDDLRLKAESMPTRAALNTEHFQQFNLPDGSTFYGVQTPAGAIKGKGMVEAPGLGTSPPQSKPEMTPAQAFRRQTELTRLLSKADEPNAMGQLLQDPKLKDALKKRADAGDQGAKSALGGGTDNDSAKVYRQAILDEMKYVQGFMQPKTAPPGAQQNTSGSSLKAPSDLVGRPPGKVKANGVERWWDGKQIIW